MYEQNYNPYSQNVDVIKKYFNNSTVLVLAILRFVMIVISLGSLVVSAIVSTPLITQYAENMLKQFGQSVDLSNVDVSSSATSSVISSIFSAVPGLAISTLMGVALILIYTKSRNASPTASPKAGFTILYVISIIGLVSTILGLVMVLGVMVLMIVMVSLTGTYLNSEGISDYNTMFTFLMGVYIGIIIVALVFMIFLLIYSINHLRYISGIRSSMNSINLSNKGAGGFGAMSILFAVFSGLYVLSVIATVICINLFSGMLGEYAFVTQMTPVYIVVIISSIVSFVYYIFDAKLALGYKKYINSVKSSYNEPAAEGPGAPPVGGYPAAPQPVYMPQPQPTYAPQPQPQPQPQQQPVPQPQPAPQPKPQPQPIPRPATNPDLMAPKLCPNCGSQVDGDSKFCNICGYRVG